MFIQWLRRQLLTNQVSTEDLDALRARLTAIEGEGGVGVSEADITALQARYVTESAHLATRVAELEAEVATFRARDKTFALAIEEGIERVDRAERRIKATVARAKKELRDNGAASTAALDEEALNLFGADDERSASSGVPPVSTEVESVDEAPSSIRGVSRETLRRVRGM